MKRHATATLLLLWLACGAQARPVVKGATAYAPNTPIVLKAEQISSKAANFLWDVSGEAKFIEAGDTLYIWAPPGDYVVRLTAIDFEAKKVERTQFAFTVTGPPSPPPGPPNPPDPPKPLGKGLHVLILYESADITKMPPQQQGVLYGKAVKDWLNQNCSPWSTIKDWGIFDKDVDLSAYSPTLNALKNRPRASVPWVVIAADGPTVLYEGPLPADATSMLKLLEKYRPSSSQRRKAG